MHALKRSGTLLAGVVVLAGVLAPNLAFATGPGGSQFDLSGENQQGESQTIGSRISFHGATRGSGGGDSGGLEPMTNWSPPACWYEPKWNPDEFAKHFQEAWDIPTASGVGEAYNIAKEHFQNGKPYKDFNKAEAGKGMWWDAVRDPARGKAGDPAAFACDTATFWVKNGETPTVKNAVTPEVLAQLAYNKIKLPDTKVTLAPPGPTKVNLPTWAWLDKKNFKPVSVTAELNVPGWSLQATTTAKSISLKLEPGTPDATTYPASGECTFNDDGSIGKAWAPGLGNQDPPCGIKYLRSSAGGSFPLKATITWQVTWTGTGRPNPTGLPNGVFGKTQNVVVEEAQAVSR
ncbi:hypothetical protein [Streptomyces alanosinicus]|uniref:Enoyl reductase n=1 Tax=Streptomyces alanosinicus TaxID=68171 RepID=A0A919D684_9ACTN|nr:hypothetical protein [Streptomyces alanosinicus]GHE11710.1 hypothetical protein GCM10010339_72420 [Streptomyces alanosinicus]